MGKDQTLAEEMLGEEKKITAKELYDMEQKKLLQKKEDVETTKKMLDAVHDVTIFIAECVKEGWSYSNVFELIKISSTVGDVIKEGSEILPELKDLDKEEAEELAGKLYETVKEVVLLFKTEEE